MIGVYKSKECFFVETWCICTRSLVYTEEYGVVLVDFLVMEKRG